MRALMIAFGAALMMLAACSLPAMNKEAEAAAKKFYNDVRAGADMTANPALSPELKTPETAAKIAELKEIIGPGEPTSVKNAGVSFNTNAGQGTQAQFTHTYTYPDRVLTVKTVLHQAVANGPWLIVGFHVDRQPVGAAASEGAAPPAAPPPESAVGSSTSGVEDEAAPSGVDTPNEDGGAREEPRPSKTAT